MGVCCRFVSAIVHPYAFLRGTKMSDPDVDSWRQRGCVFLWRDPREMRNFPGWNFTADAEGLASVLDLVARILRARWSAKATMVVNPPSQDTPPAPRYSASVRPARFTLRFPVGKVAERFWEWAGSSAHPLLTVGHAKLAELHKALSMLAAREDDFRVGADDQKHYEVAPERLSMWFWSTE